MEFDTGEILSVSALNRAVRGLLEGHFGAVWLEGEISNLAKPSSGHWYFSLKDPTAQVRCAMFRARNALLGFRPENGTQVLAYARVSLYEPRGEFQLVIERLEPAGEGLLRLRFDELKRRLAVAGLFDVEHKRPLPAQPRALGVVTSPTGAALRDILQVLRRRCPNLPVIVYPTPVQGAAAIPGLVAALESANRRAEVDVLIIARGGGSLEDLWAFNEEAVVRAIYASVIPVISGVGHETDITLTDLVADLRAPTPSAAAELCAPDTRAVLRHLAQSQTRLLRAMHHYLQRLHQHHQHLQQRLMHPGRRLEQHAQRLDELSRRLPRALDKLLVQRRTAFASLHARLYAQAPAARLVNLQHQLATLARRLPFATTTRLRVLEARLTRAEQTLRAVSPPATLARGYAIITTEHGVIVRNTDQLNRDSLISAQVGHGEFRARVEDIEPES